MFLIIVKNKHSLANMDALHPVRYLAMLSLVKNRCQGLQPLAGLRFLFIC